MITHGRPSSESRTRFRCRYRLRPQDSSDISGQCGSCPHRSLDQFVARPTLNIPAPPPAPEITARQIPLGEIISDLFFGSLVVNRASVETVHI
jgi:hypothetical protein